MEYEVKKLIVFSLIMAASSTAHADCPSSIDGVWSGLSTHIDTKGAKQTIYPNAIQISVSNGKGQILHEYHSSSYPVSDKGASPIGSVTYDSSSCTVVASDAGAYGFVTNGGTIIQLVISESGKGTSSTQSMTLYKQ